MVFGFFSRKLAPTTTIAETAVEAGPSTVEDDTISPQFKFPPPQTQLHTPSPSIDSSALLLSEKPKPKPKPRARPKPKPKPVEPKHASPDNVPPDTPSPPPEDLTVPVTDPSALYSLISSVPAQTLHTYTLAHLSPVPPSPFPFTTLSGLPPIAPPTSDILTSLTTFFSSLAPPPKLHCVRCHRGYFELENADTACRIPHDDDSAIVERVGLTRGADAGYETLWGCCAKTVDGDGDMGPPDGWCYEGAHTVCLFFLFCSFVFILCFIVYHFLSFALIFTQIIFLLLLTSKKITDRHQTRPIPRRLHASKRQTHILPRDALPHATPPTTQQPRLRLEEAKPTRYGNRW